jgi:uncharacterized membrane protein
MKNSSERIEGVNLARGLGWFSLALGATQLVAPRTLARTIGIEPGLGVSVLMRALGAREVASGLAVLMEPRRPLPLWARVGGDIADLGLLALAFAAKRTSTPRLLGAVTAVGGALALDVVAARKIQTHFEEVNRPVVYSVTINESPEKVYAFYRNLAQLPRFMDYLQSVHEISRTRSHWIARLPVGGTIAWDAEIVEDTPGRAITWRTVEDSSLQLAGRVTFTRAPARDATEVRVEMKLGFTGKRPSSLLAKLFAKPQIKGDLRRLKQVIETGEVLYSDATETRKPRPAQPIERVERYPQVFVPHPPTARKGVTP